MPDPGFEPPTSWLLEWSLRPLSHSDSCFQTVESSFNETIKWWPYLNLWMQLIIFLLHCVIKPRPSLVSLLSSSPSFCIFNQSKFTAWKFCILIAQTYKKLESWWAWKLEMVSALYFNWSTFSKDLNFSPFLLQTLKNCEEKYKSTPRKDLNPCI